MEESVILHRLESRLPGQKVQAIDELTGIVKVTGRLQFSNKLSLFSSFKRILLDEDLLLRTKCTKLICEILPKLGADMDTCMSFVMPNLLGNMAANNLVLKRESIKLIRCFSEITSDKNSLARSIIWEGIDNKDPAIAREVILTVDKLILNILQTEDCYNIVTALCKRHYLEDNKKVKKAIKDSFSSITAVISPNKMEEVITQLPTSALSSGKELMSTIKNTEKQPKAVFYKNSGISHVNSNKMEADSAISLENKLLWDLIPDSTLTRLHGDDIVEQIKAIAELESAIRRVTVPTDFLICIEEICEAIIKVIPINNFRVFKASTVLVSTFVEVFRDVIGDCVFPLTKALCHKIGDNKIAVREGTMKCLIQLMKVCGPRPVVDVVLVNFRDRNPRIREEAMNVVIKTLLTFPVHELNVAVLADYFAVGLNDHRQRVANTALEGLSVLNQRLSPRESHIIYQAVEKVDSPDKRFLTAIKERLSRGNVGGADGLITHGEGCFTRNSTTLSGVHRLGSISVPTTAAERAAEGNLPPPTPVSVPRRYFSAGRNRLPWERPSRQNTLLDNTQGAEEQYPGGGSRDRTAAGGGGVFGNTRVATDRSHVFIKGGGARTDGGSYAQMHLKKIQLENGEVESAKPPSPRSNALGSLKKYFPSVQGSPDPKRSWPSVSTRNNEDEANNGSGSCPPTKSNSFSNDSYGVQTSSMYASYRINSGESSGVGTLTSNTPNGSALPPRGTPQANPTQNSPPSTLHDSGIFDDSSFTTSKRSSPFTADDTRPNSLNHTTAAVTADEQTCKQTNRSRNQSCSPGKPGSRGASPEDRGNQRLEQAKLDKSRLEELGKEDRRRTRIQKEHRRGDVAGGPHRGGGGDTGDNEVDMKVDAYHIGNGYVEMNAAKKKLKQAAEDAKKPRPKLIKAKPRTDTISSDTSVGIDIVGKGLSSNHIETDTHQREAVSDKRYLHDDKEPLRAPSGVYGQRVQPAYSPDDGSLSDNSEDDSSDKDDDERGNIRDGHPAGSGLSAATRMRFEKKRAQYVERQSAEHRRGELNPRGGGRGEEEEGEEMRTPPEPTRRLERTPPEGGGPRAQYGKPVSAPVESRQEPTLGVKKSSSKTQIRASSLRPHDNGGDPEVQNSSLLDEKEEVPLINPEAAANEAVKDLKIGGEEWNYKVHGLHLLRRLAKHHPDNFQNDLVTYVRLTCAEVSNLRSQVSRLAIQIIGDYFTIFKGGMDSDLDRTCECLLIKAGEHNQFIRNDIVVTLSKVVEHGTPARVLSALLNSGTYHKNATVRAVSALCFKDVVARMGVNKCLNTKDIVSKFLAALDKLSHDGNQETRYYGRLILSWCLDNPNFDSLCNRHLSAASARNIRNMCDKIVTKGVGTLPAASDRTSGRFRSQPVSRAPSNLSATYPATTSARKISNEAADTGESPRVARRAAGPRRDVRESVVADKMPASLYENLNSNNWQDRYAGIAELLELSLKQTSDVRQCILRISDAFTPRLKDPNSKVNLYALQCLVRMLPHLESSVEHVLTPFTEQLIPNLASQRANIVTLTSQILDGFRTHVDNPLLLCEYCRVLKSQGNPRIKPIILDKISDLVLTVHETRPKLVEQMVVSVLIDNAEQLLQQGAGTTAAYVGRLAKILNQCMGERLFSEISRTRPGVVSTIREYLASNT